MSSAQKKIGGVSTRFGVGILYGSRISFATRLKNGRIMAFSQDVSEQSRIYKIPFLRSLMIFRQLILVFLLARRNLVHLAKENLIDLQRKKRLFHGFLFIFLYVGFFFMLDPLLTELVPVLQWIILVLAFFIMIRLFFYLVLGLQSLKYHGAEHKVINTFLSGAPLTLHAAQQHSRFAFRCGTTLATFFILLQFIIPENFYYLFFSFFGSTGGSLVIFFLVLGFAYETLSILSKQRKNKLLSWLTSLLCKMQVLTTQEPSLAELEVALLAIREAVNWPTELKSTMLP